MLCIGKAHAEIISIHASVRKRQQTWRKNVCFFVQTAEKCSAFARNKGERAGKIKISGGFSPVLECEPDGGTMNAYGSHRGCGVSMGRLSRGSLLCYSGRLELRGGTNEGSGLECFGVFWRKEKNSSPGGHRGAGRFIRRQAEGLLDPAWRTRPR